MMSWRPSLQGRRGPRYRAIAQALAEDVENGRLLPGQKLPTHRELAFALGVTIGTITRAYAEAERQGLTAGEVGRGTFVRTRFDTVQPSTEARYEFGMNAPIGGSEAECFSQALHRLAESPTLSELCSYPDLAGLPEHRIAACRLLASLDVPALPERTMLTAGGGGALSAALDLLVRPGDTIATEELTYPNFKALARLRDVRLRGLACDPDGILVDAFAEAASDGGIKALYCIPTMHNPTGLTWSIERRRAIAEIAQRHRIPIIEDDVYGFLVPERPPSFVSLAPELVLHVNAASKSLAPALRLGLLVVPQPFVGRLTGSHWIASPLMAEIVRLWVEDGTAARLMEEKRREGAARQAIVRRVLAQAGLRHASSHANAFHLWLPLPEGWRDNDAVAAAARIGIAVNPASAFAVGRSEHNAIRLCFSRPAEREQVERGVTKLAELLAGSPEAAAPIV
jgi:DNA-binding transcriptional MocR family regulator